MPLQMCSLLGPVRLACLRSFPSCALSCSGTVVSGRSRGSPSTFSHSDTSDDSYLYTIYS